MSTRTEQLVLSAMLLQLLSVSNQRFGVNDFTYTEQTVVQKVCVF